MKNKTNKRAFTIVELVIVIAVIAVLAAVLIPTFSNLVKKAQVSSDTQLVRNLNTSLKTDEALNGKHNTMQEALDAVYESGFDLAKIMNTKATENTILWDSKNDVFCYLNGDEVVYLPESTDGEKLNKGDYQLWKIYSTASEMEGETYSAYLTGEGWASEITVDGKGLDVGNVTGITSVKYNSDSSNEVTIRTNSEETALSVEAPNGVVKHYDKAKSVNIIAVKASSYHEYGKVLGNIELANGRVVMETGSTSAAIKVTANAEDIESGSVTVSVDNTAVSGVAIVVPEEVKEAIANRGGDNSITAKEEEIITDSTTIENMSKFAGGLGTENSPYLISNVMEFKNIQSGTSKIIKYYKIINELTFNSNDVELGETNGKYGIGAYYPNTTKYINIDGQGYDIICESSASLFDYFYSSTISNLNIKDNQSSIIGEAYNSTLNNINTYGDIDWSESPGNNSLFVTYADYTVTLNNCDNYATINGAGGNGGYESIYVAYRYKASSFSGLTLNFTDCDNYGSITCGRASMFIANSSQGYTNLNISNCNNYGTIRSTYMEYTPNCFCSISENKIKTIKVNDEKVDLNTTFSQGFYHGPNDTITLSKNEDGTLNFTKSNSTDVSYYIVSIGLYVTTSDGSNRYYVTERIDSTAAENYVTSLKNLSFVDTQWLNENTSAISGIIAGNITYTLNDITYYYMNEDGCTLNGKVKSPSMISVSAYDASGKLISSASIS